MKIRTVEMLERGRGKFVETEIPEGSWVAIFNSLDTAVPASEMKPVLSLPVEMLHVSDNAEGRIKLNEYIKKERIAIVSNDEVHPQLYVLGFIPPYNIGDEDYPEYCDHGHWQYALVADKPFGVICWENREYYNDYYSLDWEDFVMAKEVVGKRLTTKRLKIRHPKFVRGDLNWRWTRLSDLAEVLGEDPMTVWKFYFHICIGTSRICPGATEHALRVCNGDAPNCSGETDEEWIGAVPLPRRLEGALREQFPDSYDDSDRERWNKLSAPDKVWVPAGWAMTACYLHHFGFKPLQAVPAVPQEV
jgi:hypothetical protein